MSRYIDADLIRYDEDIPGVFIASKTRINNIPTADVRENVKAEKVISKHCVNDITTRWFECSYCGQAVDLMDNFCKNCGADIRG